MEKEATNESNRIEISDAVILDIAWRAIAGTPGFHSMSSRFYDGVMDELSKNFGQKRIAGMNVKHKKECLEINIYINVWYGTKMGDMARELRSTIREQMKLMLDLDDVRVDVHFENIYVQGEEKAADADKESLDETEE